MIFHQPMIFSKAWKELPPKSLIPCLKPLCPCLIGRKREDEAKERAKEAKRQQEEVKRLQQEMKRQRLEMKREIDLLKSEETSFESLFLSFAHSPLFFLFFFFVFLTKMTQPFFLSTALLSWLFPTLCFGGHLESSVLTSLQQSIFFCFFFCGMRVND